MYSMKGFTDFTREETVGIDPTAILNRSMSSTSSSSRSLFRRVNLEGRNVGAAMLIRRNATSSGESNDSCGINIYISNNVQGVNNSVLVGSRVNLGDPGVWLTMKDSKFGRGFWEHGRSNLTNGFCGVLAFLAVLVSLIIFFSLEF